MFTNIKSIRLGSPGKPIRLIKDYLEIKILSDRQGNLSKYINTYIFSNIQK